MRKALSLIGIPVLIILIGLSCAPSNTVKGQANASPTNPPATAPVKPPIKGPGAAPIEMPTVPPVAEPGKVVEPFRGKDGNTKGDIDWGEGMIHATGKSVVDIANTNQAQAVLMAERGAVVDAQRNLLEITEGVRVNGETVVKDYITRSDIVLSKVDGIIKGARMIGDAKYDSTRGIVSVELMMPLYGEKGVSDALEPDRTPDDTRLPPPTPEVARLMSKYSSIVIQGAGTNAKPALFPKLYDDKGNLILDTRTLVGSNATIGAGAVQFVDNLNSIINSPELGSNPLIIKVKEVAGKYLSDYVIPAEQATILTGLKAAWPYILKAGRFLLSLVLL